MSKNLVTEVARKKVLIPNEKTIRAMKAARNGKLTTVGSIKNLVDSLKK